MILAASAFKFDIDPLAWKIIPTLDLGPFGISPHGIGIAVGFLVGAQLAVSRARKRGGPEENDFWNALFWALLGAIIGARVGYVIGHFSQVTEGGDDWLGIFRVWEGGISLIGGITGAILAALPYILRRKMGFWQTMDFAAPGMALGIVIGRIGDLIIGDHLGKPTDFALGWRCLGSPTGPPLEAERYVQAVRAGNRPSLGCFDIVLHQTALYDFFSTIALLAVLLWLGRKMRNTGFLILVFAVWYGAMRVITDFLRVDKRYFGLTGSQLVTLIVGVIALYLLARYRGAPPGWVRAGVVGGGPPEGPPGAGDREPLVPVGAPPEASESLPVTESDEESPNSRRTDDAP